MARMTRDPARALREARPKPSARMGPEKGKAGTRRDVVPRAALWPGSRALFRAPLVPAAVSSF